MQAVPDTAAEEEDDNKGDGEDPEAAASDAASNTAGEDGSDGGLADFNDSAPSGEAMAVDVSSQTPRASKAGTMQKLINYAAEHQKEAKDLNSPSQARLLRSGSKHKRPSKKVRTQKSSKPRPDS